MVHNQIGTRWKFSIYSHNTLQKIDTYATFKEQQTRARLLQIAGMPGGRQASMFTQQSSAPRTQVTNFANVYLVQNSGDINFIDMSAPCNEYYIEQVAGRYYYAGALAGNTAALVKFPDSGVGFSRYGPPDRGGYDAQENEHVGQGDHYLYPHVAAGLFGVVYQLAQHNVDIALGDMSSNNGSDPWEIVYRKSNLSGHHKGHGHHGNRSGLDVDFRYLNNNGQSFQNTKATTSASFSKSYNELVYQTAYRYGFTKNFHGTRAPKLLNARPATGHNDHGHLGHSNTFNILNFSSI